MFEETMQEMQSMFRDMQMIYYLRKYNHYDDKMIEARQAYQDAEVERTKVEKKIFDLDPTLANQERVRSVELDKPHEKVASTEHSPQVTSSEGQPGCIIS